MSHTFSLYEQRILGVLMEKEVTTPDQYPLSLNTLTNACNQKSNRDPVLNLDESVVAETLDALEQKKLVFRITQGSRVQKFKHRFCNTEFGDLRFNKQQFAVICELLLRGPQTPGELRSHCLRMAPFRDVTEMETVLQSLLQRDEGALIALLPKEPGKREAKYMHLFGDVLPLENAGEPQQETVSLVASQARIEQLEKEIAALKKQNAELVQRLRQLGEIA